MEMSVQLEKPSSIVRKLTIRVPAKVVAGHLERGLVEVQKTAKLKGFRPGQVPINVIKQYYGEDVRHRVFHNVIDEAYQEALREQKLRAIGAPKIDTPDHKTGEGAHDHSVKEDQDLTFTATIEVLPELEIKGYTGIALTRETVSITDDDVEKVVSGIRDAQAELVPASGGLALADGSMSSRPVQKGDHVDMDFRGGMVTANGIEEKPGMKGNRMLEVGAGDLIPGFEDELVGMRRTETKTFRLKFPADFADKTMAGGECEFTVTVNEVKEKKLPALDDEFAKTMGYEGLADLRKKAHDHLVRERTDEVERKLRGELVSAVIEKNPFECPMALVESQTRALAQDWAEELKRQGVDDATIQQAIMSELEGLRKRAEGQVRASLVLEAIAKKESIEVSPDDFENELKTAAASMKVEVEKMREFYDKNPGRKDDFSFRLRQERTLKFLLDKAKIKAKS
jgi:trigger factor